MAFNDTEYFHFINSGTELSDVNILNTSKNTLNKKITVDLESLIEVINKVDDVDVILSMLKAASNTALQEFLSDRIEVLGSNSRESVIESMFESSAAKGFKR